MGIKQDINSLKQDIADVARADGGWLVVYHVAPDGYRGTDGQLYSGAEIDALAETHEVAMIAFFEGLEGQGNQVFGEPPRIPNPSHRRREGDEWPT